MSKEFNNKQPSEASGTSPNISEDYVEITETPVGTPIFIEEHICSIDGIAFPEGGHYAKLLGVVDSNGSKFVRVYYNGERTYPIEYARSELKKKSTAVLGVPITGTGGKIIIECVGVNDKACGVKREILMSDAHHVRRCRDCQKVYNKLATKQRMKELRAKRRANAAAQKEASGRVSGDVHRQENKD